MKIKFFAVVLVSLIVVSVMVLALPMNKGIDKAKEVSPAIDDDGHIVPLQLPENELTKIVFIRYKPGFQKEKPCDNDGVCDADERGWCNDCKTKEEPTPTTACYDFLAGSKPKWKWTEDYYYNDNGLGKSSKSAVTKWNAVSTTIFGEGISESYPWGIYDYKNSILYDDYPEEGVLGVTAIWYRGKNIYEYDIMLDIDFFPNGQYDLDTVVLHELGHAAGLDDLYDVVCIEEVMYGYLGEEETKTTLGDGDIAGIQKLYS